MRVLLFTPKQDNLYNHSYTKALLLPIRQFQNSNYP